MKCQYRLAIATIALVWTCPATAQEVYKSIDEQGRVTYSSSPPPDAAQEMVEQVPITPGPSRQEQEAAKQRAGALRADVQGAEKRRRTQAAKAKEAATDAKQELRKAEIALQEAQIKGDDDWQVLATGGRVLKQSYLDRVKDAERRFKQAENELRGSGSTKR